MDRTTCEHFNPSGLLCEDCIRENANGLKPDELASAIRDMPTECDFCGNKTEPGNLIPQSGGQWACDECWDRLSK